MLPVQQLATQWRPPPGTRGGLVTPHDHHTDIYFARRYFFPQEAGNLPVYLGRVTVRLRRRKRSFGSSFPECLRSCPQHFLAHQNVLLKKLGIFFGLETHQASVLPRRLARKRLQFVEEDGQQRIDQQRHQHERDDRAAVSQRFP